MSPNQLRLETSSSTSRAPAPVSNDKNRLIFDIERCSGAHDYVGAVMKCRIMAAIDLGLRRGEMLKITNHDVNWKGRPVPVLTIQWGNAKSRKEREIPLTSARVLRFLKSRRLVGGRKAFHLVVRPGNESRTFERRGKRY